jgi:hypothetical protein
MTTFDSSASAGPAGGPSTATIVPMADQTTSQPLEEQLKEIGAQLAWVRDYL